jgi:hypothetical protein
VQPCVPMPVVVPRRPEQQLELRFVVPVFRERLHRAWLCVVLGFGRSMGPCLRLCMVDYSQHCAHLGPGRLRTTRATRTPSTFVAHPACGACQNGVSQRPMDRRCRFGAAVHQFRAAIFLSCRREADGSFVCACFMPCACACCLCLLPLLVLVVAKRCL